MPFPLAALAIPALIGAAGTAASAYANYRSGQRAQDTNLQAMQSRHQWEQADLKAAGLNPILGYSKGGGGSQGMPGVQSSFPDMGQSASTALQAGAMAAKSDAEINVLTEEVMNRRVVRGLNEAQTKAAVKQANNFAAQADKAFSESLGQDYKNIKDAVKTKFASDNGWLLKAQQISESLGVQVKDFLNIVNFITLKKFGSSFFNPSSKYKGKFDPSTGEISPGTYKSYPPKYK